MKSPFTKILILFTFLGYSASAARAIDHSNLDEGRPLRIEDPYSIKQRELAIEAGLGFAAERRGDDRLFIPVELLYGAFPNFQIGIGTGFSSEPADEEARFGDINIEALYNFNQETLSIPALGVKVGISAPTGVDSAGTILVAKGLVTKSVGRLSIHGNAAYKFFNGDGEGEEDNRLEFILGASYPLGAPGYTRLTVIGDVFTDLSVERDDTNIVGTEFGLRYQLTQRVVLDTGIGSEFTAASDRAPFYVTAGVSVGF